MEVKDSNRKILIRYPRFIQFYSSHFFQIPRCMKKIIVHIHQFSYLYSYLKLNDPGIDNVFIIIYLLEQEDDYQIKSKW